MRYEDGGCVHLDFHRTMNGTIAYLRTTHGEAILEEVVRRTAREVYRSIRDDLKRGDPAQLVRHWRYYFDRENGAYDIERDGDVVRLIVHRCPAIAYLEARGIAADPAFCRQTAVLNEALAEDTPFAIDTHLLGPARCVQILRRRAP